MSHRIATSIVGGLFFIMSVALLSVAAPATASAAAQPHWRPGTTVCVDLPSAFVTWRWNIREELYRWNVLAGGPRFVARQVCSNYTNSVRIRVRYSNSGAQAITYQDYNWATGVMKHADVFLNPQGVTDWFKRNPYTSRSKAGCLRSWALGHEVGHVDGAEHHVTGYNGNVMAYNGWWNSCGRLGPNDRAQHYRIY